MDLVKTLDEVEKVDKEPATRKTSIILVNENKIRETADMDEEPTVNHRKLSTNSAKRRRGRNNINCDVLMNKWPTVTEAATIDTATSGVDANSRFRK